MPTALPEPKSPAPGPGELALRSLARVRLATAPAFTAFARRMGVPDGAIERWTADGILRRTPCHPTLGDGPPTDVLSLSPKGAKALSVAAGRTVASVSAARLHRSGAKLLPPSSDQL